MRQGYRRGQKRSQCKGGSPRNTLSRFQGNIVVPQISSRLALRWCNGSDKRTAPRQSLRAQTGVVVQCRRARQSFAAPSLRQTSMAALEGLKQIMQASARFGERAPGGVLFTSTLPVLFNA